MSTATNGSSITVRWSPVPCLQRNSQITGYVVRYTEVTSSRTTSADTNVTGGSSTSITINGLQGSTRYSIEVAAVGAGETGVFSSPITANASKSKYYSLQSDGGGGGGGGFARGSYCMAALYMPYAVFTLVIICIPVGVGT